MSVRQWLELCFIGFFVISKSSSALISGQRSHLIRTPNKKIRSFQIKRKTLREKGWDSYSSILAAKDANDPDQDVLAITPSVTNDSITDIITQQPLVATALLTLTSMPIMAKVGLLGQDYVYQPQLILQDFGATTLVLTLSVAFVKFITYLVKADLMKPRDSRKTIHTLSAPLFLAFWPLFSNASGARFFAMIVPLMNLARLLLAGSGKEKGGEEDLAKAVSRSGEAGEALGGPLIYVLVLLFSTVGFWTNNFVGVTAICIMSIGDGLADIVGRRLGKNNKWKFSPDKSIAGTLAFIAGSTLGSITISSWLDYAGAIHLPFPMAGLATRLFLICTICAFVELFPIIDDNVSVPASAMFLSSLLLM